MNRAEVFLGTILDSRFRLDVIVRESPDFIAFQGRDLKRNKMVDIRMARALRGLSPEELQEAYDRFAVEADQLSQLSKATNDVEELLASGQFEGPEQEHLAYCVFAHIEGLPLSQTHPSGSPPMPLDRAIAMLEPVAMALATAHELGVFHGDVRPENMIVVVSGDKSTLKLANFTRATRLGDDTAARTFSAAYGAPEHHKKSVGDNGVGPPTDTYGLALTLVELVSGRPPLVGTTPGELYKEALDIAKRPTFRRRGANVVDDVESVIERAVAVNPKLRWPKTTDFWSALTEAASPVRAPTTTAPLLHQPPTLPEAIPVPAIGLLNASALAEAAGAAFAELPPAPATPQPSLQPVPPSIHPPSTAAPPPPKAKKSRKGVLVFFLVLLAGLGGAGYYFRKKLPFAIPTMAPTTRPTSPPSASSSAPIATPPPSAAPSASASLPVIARAAPEGMVHIPAGTFTMGKDEGKPDRVAHKVVLTHAFYMDRNEVTIDQYNACIEKGACTQRLVHVKRTITSAWGCNLDKEHGSYPANCVDRKQAIAYCSFVNKRLPTEAEWEYAARGTDEREYPWGNNAPRSCKLAVLSGMTGTCGERHGTVPIGSAPEGASPFGVLDMGGNVWEWVADNYGPYPSSEVTDPLVTSTEGPEAPLRGVLRGGSWDYGPESAKTTYRLPFIADAGNASVGVRCALSD